jgi:hypothetical protein
VDVFLQCDLDSCCYDTEYSDHDELARWFRGPPQLVRIGDHFTDEREHIDDCGGEFRFTILPVITTAESAL